MISFKKYKSYLEGHGYKQGISVMVPQDNMKVVEFWVNPENVYPEIKCKVYLELTEDKDGLLVESENIHTVFDYFPQQGGFWVENKPDLSKSYWKDVNEYEVES